MIELADIVGQEAAISQLQKAMAAERMPHAYLFAGPDGVGRRTTAMALAKTLLCQRPGPPGAAGGAALFGQQPAEGPVLVQACGQCEDCRMFEAGSHPDLHMIYKELVAYHTDSKLRTHKMQELGIPVIREFLIAPANLFPGRGRGKVFVVLEAELMSHAAQNALLKTLEEPPAGVTIILICERPDELLPTTLSRCWQVRFGALPRQFVVEKLLEAQVQPQEAEFWAAFTDGSVGRALDLSARGLYEVKSRIVQRLGAMGRGGDAELGPDMVKVMDKLAGAAIKRSREASGPELADSVAKRQAAGVMLELIASLYRDALRLAAARAATEEGQPSADQLAAELVNADQLQAVQAVAGRFQPGQIAEIIEQLSTMEELLWRNVNAKIMWDNVTVTCATAAPLPL